MRYLMFTYVNLKFPNVKGLKFEFGLFSRYPLANGEVETFYGSCDDDADISVDGVISEVFGADFIDAKNKEFYARKKVPDEVTSAQAQVALFDNGYLPKVEELIANHPYPKVRIWFRAASNWRRDNPNISAVAMELGLTDDQVDDLFIYAGKVVE